ncbi:MAG TPA: hypothetical protein VGI75_05695 [Pirellulales bacterium]|jgi:hypothetical protein
MRHDEHNNLESAGQDSFLDVTTNIVGILIVLVMVVGMRAQNPIVEASPNSDHPAANSGVPTAGEVETLGKNAATLESDVLNIAGEMRSIDREIDEHNAQREVLATMISAAQNDLGDRRAKLDAAQQEDFDLKRQLAESEKTVDEDGAELDEIKSEKPQVQIVKHYPTPISRTVLGHEVHYQLLGGRVTYVPVDEFIDDVRNDLRNAQGDYSSLADKVGVVGPRNGFEFRYTMDVAYDRGRGGVSIRTKEFQVVPVGSELGETVQQALSQRSEFRTVLAMHSPRDTTVTLWVYPDSFDLYRQLKEELHNLGYATAGRPLPEGVLIGGSSDGTRSSAQ